MGRRARRVLIGVLVAVVVLGAAAAAGIGWHYSNLILGPDRPSALEEQRVLAAAPDRVELSRDRESLEPGRWALQWQDGFGAVGDILETTDTSVVRTFRAVVGTPPVGRLASLKGVSRSANPRTMLGLPFEETRLTGPLGSYPAWFVPGPDSIWVVYVHGRAANRAEALRALSVLAARGLPGLLITYRNDLGAPASADGRYHLGQDEWLDVEPAVRHALDRGARGVVLAGYSMGGQIVMQFMTHSTLAPNVRAIVLESPVLDWSATLDYRARQTGVPPFVTRLGERVASARAGLDWRRLDRVANARGLTTPVLLFHNVPDRMTPIAISEKLAGALPGVVTLVRVEGGNHVEAWNVDAEGYAEALNAWFTARGIGATPTAVTAR